MAETTLASQLGQADRQLVSTAADALDQEAQAAALAERDYWSGRAGYSEQYQRDAAEAERDYCVAMAEARDALDSGGARSASSLRLSRREFLRFAPFRLATDFQNRASARPLGGQVGPDNARAVGPWGGVDGASPPRRKP